MRFSFVLTFGFDIASSHVPTELLLWLLARVPELLYKDHCNNKCAL